MNGLKIAVLRGGPSLEYEVSLKSGQNIIKNLKADKYSVCDILISRDGTWHKEGLVSSPVDALEGVDVAINSLHGSYGEDGQVQKILERLHVPYTGSRGLPASWSLNKEIAKDFYTKSYLKTPSHILIEKSDEDPEAVAYRLFREVPQPLIIKPVFGGSSKDISVVEHFYDLVSAIEKAYESNEPFIAEEFIRGREVSCGVVEDFRGERTYALLPVEVRPKKRHFSFEEKCGLEDRNIVCPPEFSREEKRIIEELAKEAHEALGLRHYSQSDFIISPNGIYIIETNSLPGLSEHALLPASLEASGSSLSDFLEHLIEKAINK